MDLTLIEPAARSLGLHLITLQNTGVAWRVGIGVLGLLETSTELRVCIWDKIKQA